MKRNRACVYIKTNAHKSGIHCADAALISLRMRKLLYLSYKVNCKKIAL